MTASKSMLILGGLLIAGLSFALIIGTMAWLMPHFITFSQSLLAKLILPVVFSLTVFAFFLASRHHRSVSGKRH